MAKIVFSGPGVMGRPIVLDSAPGFRVQRRDKDLGISQAAVREAGLALRAASPLRDLMRASKHTGAAELPSGRQRMARP